MLTFIGVCRFLFVNTDNRRNLPHTVKLFDIPFDRFHPFIRPFGRSSNRQCQFHIELSLMHLGDQIGADPGTDDEYGKQKESHQTADNPCLMIE